jgi:hypothetical protein
VREFDHFGDCFCTCALIIWTVLLHIGVWATSLLTQERQERRRGLVKNIKLALFLDMFTHYFEILNIISLSLCIRVMKDQTL